jgi:hypothetical protein
MNKCNGGRVWASPVHASMLKKRHQFGIDGRLLLFPIICPCIVVIPFCGSFVHQVLLVALAATLWMGAKVLWEFNPYALDDLLAEIKFPAFLSGDK